MTNFRMAMIAVAAATAMTGSQALAADASGALVPGKPAGVYQAQHHHGPSLWLVGGAAALAVVAVAVAVGTSSNSSCSATACPSGTTTTSTTS
jgi:hypothetical protein